MSVNLQAASPAQNLQQKLSSILDDLKYLGLKDDAAMDTYGDFGKDSGDSMLREFEAEVAKELGLEDAVFMPSGVMAQQIALCVHNDGVQGLSFMCHQSSHIVVHEQNAAKELLNAEMVQIETTTPVCVGDVEAALQRAEGSVSTVLLEHPHRELGGAMSKWDDVLAIKKLCGERGAKFHLDGARIWEVSGAGGGEKSLADIAGVFDSVYCSFYKGVGGLTGAMLLGDKEFCAKSRVWLRRFGGNLYCMAPHIVTCWAGFRRNRGTFVRKADKMKEVAGALVADEEVSKVLRFRCEVQMCFTQVILECSKERAEAARDKVREESGVTVFSRIRFAEWEGSSDKCCFEWNMGDLNGGIEVDVFVQAWRAFAKEIL